jgi:hypothetical protein
MHEQVIDCHFVVLASMRRLHYQQDQWGAVCSPQAGHVSLEGLCNKLPMYASREVPGRGTFAQHMQTAGFRKAYSALKKQVDAEAARLAPAPAGARCCELLCPLQIEHPCRCAGHAVFAA